MHQKNSIFCSKYNTLPIMPLTPYFIINDNFKGMSLYHAKRGEIFEYIVYESQLSFSGNERNEMKDVKLRTNEKREN